MGMDAFMPPRMIAGIALGPSGMEPSTSLMTALIVAMVLHMMLSVVHGLIFAWVVSTIPALRSSPAVIVATTFFGLLIWLVNFYLIAPAAVWVWFPTKANPVQQFIVHAFFFRLGPGHLRGPRPGGHSRACCGSGEGFSRTAAA